MTSCWMTLSDGSGKRKNCILMERTFIQKLMDVLFCVRNARFGGRAINILQKYYAFVKYCDIIVGNMERNTPMSITVNLYYTGKNDNARRFAEEMEQSGTADAVRAEAGNLRYEYFLPLKGPETVLLIDSWEDQHAIDRHHASPMMETIAALREKYDLHMRVERYRSDEEGIPSSDETFIRT